MALRAGGKLPLDTLEHLQRGSLAQMGLEVLDHRRGIEAPAREIR